MSSAPFLQGVRVLDVTGALAGPYCTTILSDLGAEVIKVEAVEGDAMRKRMGDASGSSLPFAVIHRNKRSIAVNLKAVEGQRILRRLAATADVFVENFRPGALAKLGLGYEDLHATCPNLVYCSISGFGQTGPKSDFKGIDLVAQAYGGLMSVTGSTDGQLAKAGYPVSDLGAAMWGSIGVLAALLRARAGGPGAYVDVALADTIAAWSVWETTEYVLTGEVPRPLGTAHRLAAPYQAFECADGETIVIGGVDRLWPPLCSALGVSDLDEDPRFGTESDRFANREALAEILGERFKLAPRDRWVETLRRVGVPCGPVNTIDEVVIDDQYAARGMFVHNPERLGYPTLVNTPVIADGAPRIQRRAPRLGEDTVAVLREIGFSETDIEALVAEDVVATVEETVRP